LSLDQCTECDCTTLLAHPFRNSVRHLEVVRLPIRSSAGPDDILHFYATMIRPVLEYAFPVWDSGLTVERRNRIVAIQKRVFRIIFDTSDYLFYSA